MTNPFEDPGGDYIVLVNAEGQYALWPDYIAIPVGWTQTGPIGDRATCLEWIDRTWTDMRPLSLAEAIDGSSVASGS